MSRFIRLTGIQGEPVGDPVYVNVDRIDALLTYYCYSGKDGCDIMFGDNFVHVQESLSEVLRMIESEDEK